MVASQSLHLLSPLEEPSKPDARNRMRRLKQGAASSVVSKGVALVVNLISIPITIRYLGPEDFGIWATISTTLSMLLVLDLGVANSLTNFVSEAYARDDRDHASTYATTALGIVLSVSLLLAGVAWCLWPSLDWNRLFHLSSASKASTVGRAVAAALAIFLSGLPAALAPKILGGYQEIRTANLFTAAGSLLNLVSIIVLVHLHAGLVALVTASSAALVGANLLALCWIFFFHKRWLMPRLKHLKVATARRIVQSGSEFFVLQVAGLIAFNMDNLIVIHYLGPAQVAAYSVAWRLVGYAAVAQTLISPALWPAFSEAFARGDLEWIRRTFRRTMVLTMSFALGGSLLFALCGRWLIRIWASHAAVPSEELLLLMCVWVVISTLMNNLATVLVAKGDTRLQALCSIGAAALNLSLSIYWVQWIGAPGVILGTIVSYLIVLVGPVIWKVCQILRHRPSIRFAGAE